MEINFIPTCIDKNTSNKIIEVCNSTYLNDFDKVKEIHNLLDKEIINCNLSARLYVNKLNERSAQTLINFYKCLINEELVFKPKIKINLKT